jgi:glycosyltransferase A (GT-A) superfamily protein (DUF2064 family)
MKQSFDSNVAVLFFSCSPEAEGGRKQFISDKRNNIRVARSFIEHTREQIRRTGLPVYEINEKLQKGDSFGERFSNAFTRLFNKGYKYIIAVGNDTPELKSSHINKADQLLTEGKAQIVLGPAEDGGTWLMGYHREAFEARSFQQLPWNTSRLFQQIIERAGNEVSISQLESFADIDNYNGLLDFANRSGFNSRSLLLLVRLIRNILSGNPVKFVSSHFLTSSSSLLSTLLLRAPPFTV